jgi:adenylylsulfate kinase
MGFAEMNTKNIVWHKTEVTRNDREKLLNQKGILLWFTGLSGSGKSTIATELEKRLHSIGKLTYILDGDNIRHGLNSDLDFSEEHRKENIRRISEVAKLFLDGGFIVISTFISPFLQERQNARELVGIDFVEVFINCSLENCEKRDPKSLYKKARNGEIKNFTGLDSPYEIPKNPELVIDTGKIDISDSVNLIVDYLIEKNILSIEEISHEK